MIAELMMLFHDKGFFWGVGGGRYGEKCYLCRGIVVAAGGRWPT